MVSGYLHILMNKSKLFGNTKDILNFATACHILPYLAIVLVYMKHCLDFSTCQLKIGQEV